MSQIFFDVFLQVGPTNGFQRNDEWWADVFREKVGRRAQMVASCRIYIFKEDRRQIVVARNICKQQLFLAYKASDENVVVRGEGGRRVCEIVRTSRKIPATPLMAIRKIVNGYRPTPHQSCNRANILRNFYGLSNNGTSVGQQERHSYQQSTRR